MLPRLPFPFEVRALRHQAKFSSFGKPFLTVCCTAVVVLATPPTGLRAATPHLEVSSGAPGCGALCVIGPFSSTNRVCSENQFVLLEAEALHPSS